MNDSASAAFGASPIGALEPGTTLYGRMTVTEPHVVLASGIFGDFAPLHVNEEYAKATRFGTRIAHGTLVTGIMGGVLGKALKARLLACTASSFRFLAPVYLGDTIATTWTVVENVPGDAPGEELVRFSGECVSQAGVLVVSGQLTAVVRGLD